MNRRLGKLYARVKKAEAKAVKLNKRLAGIAMELTSGKLVKVSLQKEKNARYKLSEEKKKLDKLVGKFQDFVSPIFGALTPVA